MTRPARADGSRRFLPWTVACAAIVTAAVGVGCTPADTGGADMASSSDAGVGTNTGFISLASTSASTRANAVFLPGGPAFNCPEQAFGDHCVYYRCTKRTPVDGLPAPSAGEITVTGGKSPLTFTPLADGTYETVLKPAALWMGGETLAVKAVGADVPAFSDSWPAPMLVTLTTPATLADPWVIPRTADLVLAWSGGAGEEVVATFGTTSSVSPIEVECTFPAGAKTGTVPSAALSMLPAGDAYYSVASRNRKSLRAGQWSILLRAESDVVLASQASVYGAATLQ